MRVIALSFLLFLYCVLMIQATGKRVEQNTRYEFGLAIVNGPNSQVATFGILTIRDEKVTKVQYLTIDHFILQVTGKTRSVANPGCINLFVKNKVPHCFAEYAPYDTNKYLGYYCPVLTDLWKVRYKRDPKNANMRQDSGWAVNYFFPSITQQQFLLKEYGIKHMSDYFIGDKMFQLLRDVVDTAWIRKYRELL